MYKVFGMAVESLFLSGNICCDLSMSLDKLVLVKENIILLLPALSFERALLHKGLKGRATLSESNLSGNLGMRAT